MSDLGGPPDNIQVQPPPNEGTNLFGRFCMWAGVAASVSAPVLTAWIYFRRRWLVLYEEGFAIEDRGGRREFHPEDVLEIDKRESSVGIRLTGITLVTNVTLTVLYRGRRERITLVYSTPRQDLHPIEEWLAKLRPTGKSDPIPKPVRRL
jgi:hypothetical protein